ncbi:MAG: hypothetical protein PHD58_02420 [Anaerolineales bacterium]|nr:hypothetical protein [Anaerolineales bacterium]
MLQKITPGTLILYLCLICVGCSGKSAQGIQATPTATQALPVVKMAAPVKGESSYSGQTIELRNCEGKDVLHHSLATKTQVVCNITIPDEATSIKTGNKRALPKDMKTRLEEQVEIAYQKIYEEAKISVEQTDLTVPVNKILTFQIYWTKQVFSSTISFTMEDEAYTAFYTYTLDIPDAIIAEDTSCTA